MTGKTEKVIPERIEALERLYALYDDFIQRRSLACTAGCDLCCTRNVTMTALEAGLIADHLEKTGQRELLEKVETAKTLPRFRPLTTTNTLAWLCRQGKNPPDETCDPAWRPCPFLTERQCSIYALRPFGCRCMVSKTVCQKGSQADMDDYVLALNTVFMQFIEHLDAAGCTGNLIDLLPLTASADGREGRIGLENGFVPNRPIEIIMLPPEYQDRARAILEKLGALFQ